MYDDREYDGETTIILAFARTGFHYLSLKGRRRREEEEKKKKKMMMMMMMMMATMSKKEYTRMY
jgi:hypothetical protein